MYIITLPLIAALIGWFTNYIAVKMLFRPRKKVKILFFELQGIFPKRQVLLAEKIGKMVANELLSIKDIKEKINHHESMKEVSNAIEGKIEDYLKNTFPSTFPLAFLISNKTKNKVKEDIMAEFTSMAPEVIEKYFENMEETIDVEAIIREKVKLLPPEKLEDLINSILKKEFQFIELIGGVLGFIIGLIQVLLVKFGV